MKWVRRGATTLVGLVVLALAILYGGSALVIRRDVNAPLPAIAAPSDPAAIAEGARLARIAGCTRCHGDRAQGRILGHVASIGQIIAPSLPQVAARSTDGQLARAIRNGVGIDARPLFIMPSGAFNGLSDDDVARLAGWIRSLPTSAYDVVGSTAVGVRGRFAILTAALPDAVTLTRGQPRQRPADTGRYFAQIACLQCHALDRDRPVAVGGLVAPALKRAIAGYDGAALTRLLRGGRGHGNRALPAMAEASRTGLAALGDAEIGAVRAYLAGGKAE